MGAITSGYLIENNTFQIVISVLLSFWVQITILVLHSAGYAVEREAENSCATPPLMDNELQGIYCGDPLQSKLNS